MPQVRVVKIPECKMVLSGAANFGDGILEKFDEWFSSLPCEVYSRDFLGYDESKKGFVWHYIYSENMDVPDDFDIIDFSGGLYAVCCGVDGKDNSAAMGEIDRFVEQSGCFTKDSRRMSLGTVTTPAEASAAMGYSLMDYLVPIKARGCLQLTRRFQTYSDEF